MEDHLLVSLTAPIVVWTVVKINHQLLLQVLQL